MSFECGARSVGAQTTQHFGVSLGLGDARPPVQSAAIATTLLER